MPAAATAQTPGAAAIHMGSIVEQIIMRPPAPWDVEIGISGTRNTGNTDNGEIAGSLFYGRDYPKWRSGMHASAIRQTADDSVTEEAYSFDLALSYAPNEKVRLVGVNDWTRAPLHGLGHQNTLGGLAVWLPDTPARIGLGVFGGGGYAFESYTDGTPDDHFFTTIAGLSTTLLLNQQSRITGSFIHSLDVSDPENYKITATAALNARIAGAWGIRLGYELGFDNEPVFNTKDTSQTFTVGLTLSLRPAPPPGQKPPAPPPGQNPSR